MFFNDAFDRQDLCSDSDDNETRISCEFAGLPKSLILDTSIETTLESEFMLNGDRNLEICRIFKFGQAVSKSTYLKALHPTNESLHNLLSLNNSALKELAKNCGADLTDVDQRKNPPLREAIRTTIGTGDLNL